MSNNIFNKIKLSLYYIIIGFVSFISLLFLPMIGTEVGLAWNIPNTTIGWIVWIVLKLIIAIINILIFHSFMQQAKINVRDNVKYKEALEILGKIKTKKYIPRSPNKWNKQQYLTKGTSLFISTALTTIAFTQAILTFDWMTMISYLFTIIMGIIFGIIQMKTAEDYWTDEFWKYAIMMKEQYNEKIMEMAQKECSKQGDDNICNNSRTDILESSNNNQSTCNTSESMVVDNSNSNNSVLVRPIHSSSTTTVRISCDNKTN